MASVDSLATRQAARGQNRGQQEGGLQLGMVAQGQHEVAPRSGTKSLSTRSGSSGPLEHAAADGSRGHEAGSMGQQQDVKASNIPLTIPLHSINGQFKGVFHLHEYLGTSSLSSPYTRLQACVTQDGSATRITPREAEMKAGKGSRKSWKLTLMTTHAGQHMTLQKYFTLLGLEKPRNPESQQTSDHVEESMEQPSKRYAWAQGSVDAHEERDSKRQHFDPQPSRRNTDESGTGNLRLDYRRDSLPTLGSGVSFGSHCDGLELRALSSHAELQGMHKLGEQRYALMQSNPGLAPMSAFATRGASGGAMDLGSSFLNSSAMTSSINRDSADMETLLRSYELSKRLSTATAHTFSLPANNNLQLHGLSSHDLDKWSVPQTTMLMQNSRLFPVQTMVGPSCLSAVPSLNRWLPVGACVLQQGFSSGGLSLPMQESSRRFHISAEAASQYGNRFQLSRAPPANSSHRQSETNSAPAMSEFIRNPGVSHTTSVPRLSHTDPILPEVLMPSVSGLRQSTPVGSPQHSVDKMDLSKVPETIPIFTPNQEVRGTLHLHDYILGTLSRPNRPPPCVVLDESEDGDPSGDGSAEVRVTPRTAEAKAGREARKNWKETFRTMHEGRVISLKAFFAMHNIN